MASPRQAYTAATHALHPKHPDRRYLERLTLKEVLDGRKYAYKERSQAVQRGDVDEAHACTEVAKVLYDRAAELAPEAVAAFGVSNVADFDKFMRQFV